LLRMRFSFPALLTGAAALSLSMFYD